MGARSLARVVEALVARANEWARSPLAKVFLGDLLNRGGTSAQDSPWRRPSP
jgi:hypothetical protein